MKASIRVLRLLAVLMIIFALTATAGAEAAFSEDPDAVESGGFR